MHKNRKKNVWDDCWFVFTCEIAYFNIQLQCRRKMVRLIVVWWTLRFQLDKLCFSCTLVTWQTINKKHNSTFPALKYRISKHRRKRYDQVIKLKENKFKEVQTNKLSLVYHLQQEVYNKNLNLASKHCEIGPLTSGLNLKQKSKSAIWSNHLILWFHSIKVTQWWSISFST